jgi:hypothetical protein
LRPTASHKISAEIHRKTGKEYVEETYSCTPILRSKTQ